MMNNEMIQKAIDEMEIVIGANIRDIAMGGIYVRQHATQTYHLIKMVEEMRLRLTPIVKVKAKK